RDRNPHHRRQYTAAGAGNGENSGGRRLWRSGGLRRLWRSAGAPDVRSCRQTAERRLCGLSIRPKGNVRPFLVAAGLIFRKTKTHLAKGAFLFFLLLLRVGQLFLFLVPFGFAVLMEVAETKSGDLTDVIDDDEGVRV